MQKGKLSAKGGSALGGKTKRKSSKPKRRLAPGWKHGNASLVILIVLVVAIVAGGVGFMLAKKTEAPSVQLQQKKEAIIGKDESWQSYKDDTLGFQVSHPNGLTVMKEVNGRNTTFYFMKSDVADQIINYQQSIKGDNSVVNSIWNAMLATKNENNAFNMVWYESNDAPVTDDNYQKDFINTYSEKTAAGTFEAKILSFKNINNASADKARIIIGEQAQTGNSSAEQIYEAELMNSKQQVKFFVSAHSENSQVVSADDFEKMISSFQFFGVSAQLQSSTVDTINWQTYTNNLYGYSIKYPSDHTAYSKVEKDVLIKALPNDNLVNIAESEELAKFSEPLLLQIQGIKTNQNSTEWFNANIAKYYSGHTASQEQILFAGQKALKITAYGDGSPSARYITIIIEKTEGLIVIFQDKSAFLDKIMSTFTFTN